jgi:hypothetical protein
VAIHIGPQPGGTMADVLAVIGSTTMTLKPWPGDLRLTCFWFLNWLMYHWSNTPSVPNYLSVLIGTQILRNL